MAKKISDLTVTTTVQDADLFETSVSDGLGGFTSRKITGANLKTIVTDANLITSDITTNNVSTTKHGFVPKAPNDTTKFLRGDGTWATAGGGITIGTTAITSGTAGRILFEGAGNVVQEDAALFWDNTNKRLGVGATPSSTVRLDVRAQSALSTDIAFRIRNSADSVTLQQFNSDGSWIHRNNANTFYEYFDGTYRIEYRRVGSVELGTNNDVTSFNFACNTGNVLLRGGTNIINIISGNNYHFEESTGLLTTSGAGCIVMKNRTAPSTNVADRFYLYSADIVAGNAAPHFRTETGDIIKLYQQSSAGITTVGQLVTVLQNLGLLS
jgi:predicted small secreted protein